MFFGAKVSAPWPHPLPKARTVDENSRHLTLAFLGNLPFSEIQKILPSFPLPPFHLGLVGKSDGLLFLPPKSFQPRVVAYHAHWFEKTQTLLTFQKNLISWLHAHDLHPDLNKQFLSHITVGRAPFNQNEWKNGYQDLPLVLESIHLYESVGQLTYEPLWSHLLIPPFEEFEHTADLAFLIRAETKKELHFHAQMALAFKFPSLLPFLFLDSLKESLDEMIIALNESVSKADEVIGCPFKAVSFHGSIEKNEKGILHWEMIIDV